jgi:hypothetical protein
VMVDFDTKYVQRHRLRSGMNEQEKRYDDWTRSLDKDSTGMDLEEGTSRKVALAWGLVVGALVVWFVFANWDAIVNVFRGGRSGGGGGREIYGDANANATDPHRAQQLAEMRARRAARAAAAEAAGAGAGVGATHGVEGANRYNRRYNRRSDGAEGARARVRGDQARRERRRRRRRGGPARRRAPDAAEQRARARDPRRRGVSGAAAVSHA